MLKMLIAGTLLVGSLVLISGLVPMLPRLRHSLEAWFVPAALADDVAGPATQEKAVDDKVRKTDDQWRRELTPEQYRVLRCSATEQPFTGKYYQHRENGVYVCAGCGNELFSSETKYESGSGWPSYYAPVDRQAVGELTDISLGTVRTEIICNRCEAHLGHVFRDGPRPTGLRYCVNSASLDFKGKAEGGVDAVQEEPGKD